jgi:hypothetical protein
MTFRAKKEASYSKRILPLFSFTYSLNQKVLKAKQIPCLEYSHVIRIGAICHSIFTYFFSIFGICFNFREILNLKPQVTLMEIVSLNGLSFKIPNLSLFPSDCPGCLSEFALLLPGQRVRRKGGTHGVF